MGRGHHRDVDAWPLSLVRVVQPAFAAPPIGIAADELGGTNVEVASAMAEAYLSNVSQRLRCKGIIATAEVVVDRNPAQAIIEHAAGDLVVMSTHSRPPVERAVLGSVTDKVVRGSGGPVVVIPACAALAGEAAEAESLLEADARLSQGAVIF